MKATVKRCGTTAWKIVTSGDECGFHVSPSTIMMDNAFPSPISAYCTLGIDAATTSISMRSPDSQYVHLTHYDQEES